MKQFHLNVEEDDEPRRGRKVYDQKIYVTALERGIRDRSPRPRQVEPPLDRIELKICPQKNHRGRMKNYRARSIPELCRITLKPTGEGEGKSFQQGQMEEVYITHYTHSFDREIDKPHIVAWKRAYEDGDVAHCDSKFCILNSPVGSNAGGYPERRRSAPPGSFVFNYDTLDMPEPLHRRSRSLGMYMNDPVDFDIHVGHNADGEMDNTLGQSAGWEMETMLSDSAGGRSGIKFNKSTNRRMDITNGTVDMNTATVNISGRGKDSHENLRPCNHEMISAEKIEQVESVDPSFWDHAFDCFKDEENNNNTKNDDVTNDDVMMGSGDVTNDDVMMSSDDVTTHHVKYNGASQNGFNISYDKHEDNTLDPTNQARSLISTLRSTVKKPDSETFLRSIHETTASSTFREITSKKRPSEKNQSKKPVVEKVKDQEDSYRKKVHPGTLPLQKVTSRIVSNPRAEITYETVKQHDVLSQKPLPHETPSRKNVPREKLSRTIAPHEDLSPMGNTGSDPDFQRKYTSTSKAKTTVTSHLSSKLSTTGRLTKYEGKEEEFPSNNGYSPVDETPSKVKDIFITKHSLINDQPSITGGDPSITEDPSMNNHPSLASGVESNSLSPISKDPVNKKITKSSPIKDNYQEPDLESNDKEVLSRRKDDVEPEQTKTSYYSYPKKHKQSKMKDTSFEQYEILEKQSSYFGYSKKDKSGYKYDNFTTHHEPSNMKEQNNEVAKQVKDKQSKHELMTVDNHENYYSNPSLRVQKQEKFQIPRKTSSEEFIAEDDEDYYQRPKPEYKTLESEETSQPKPIETTYRTQRKYEERPGSKGIILNEKKEDYQPLNFKAKSFQSTEESHPKQIDKRIYNSQPIFKVKDASDQLDQHKEYYQQPNIEVKTLKSGEISDPKQIDKTTHDRQLNNKEKPTIEQRSPGKEDEYYQKPNVEVRVLKSVESKQSSHYSQLVGTIDLNEDEKITHSTSPQVEASDQITDEDFYQNFNFESKTLKTVKAQESIRSSQNVTLVNAETSKSPSYISSNKEQTDRSPNEEYYQQPTVRTEVTLKMNLSQQTEDKNLREIPQQVEPEQDEGYYQELNHPIKKVEAQTRREVIGDERTLDNDHPTETDEDYYQQPKLEEKRKVPLTQVAELDTKGNFYKEPKSSAHPPRKCPLDHKSIEKSDKDYKKPLPDIPHDEKPSESHYEIPVDRNPSPPKCPLEEKIERNEIGDSYEQRVEHIYEDPSFAQDNVYEQFNYETMKQPAKFLDTNLYEVPGSKKEAIYEQPDRKVYENIEKTHFTPKVRYEVVKMTAEEKKVGSISSRKTSEFVDQSPEEKHTENTGPGCKQIDHKKPSTSSLRSIASSKNNSQSARVIYGGEVNTKKSIVSTTSSVRINQSDDSPKQSHSLSSEPGVLPQEPEVEVRKETIAIKAKNTKPRKTQEEFSQPSIYSRGNSGNTSLARFSSFNSDASYKRRLTSAWIEQQRMNFRKAVSREPSLRRTQSMEFHKERTPSEDHTDYKLKHSKSELSLEQLSAMYDPFNDQYFEANPNKPRAKVVHTAPSEVITKAKSVDTERRVEKVQESKNLSQMSTPTSSSKDSLLIKPSTFGEMDKNLSMERNLPREESGITKAEPLKQSSAENKTYKARPMSDDASGFDVRKYHDESEHLWIENKSQQQNDFPTRQVKPGLNQGHAKTRPQSADVSHFDITRYNDGYRNDSVEENKKVEDAMLSNNEVKSRQRPRIRPKSADVSHFDITRYNDGHRDDSVEENKKVEDAMLSNNEVKSRQRPRIRPKSADVSHFDITRYNDGHRDDSVEENKKVEDAMLSNNEVKSRQRSKTRPKSADVSHFDITKFNDRHRDDSVGQNKGKEDVTSDEIKSTQRPKVRPKSDDVSDFDITTYNDAPTLKHSKSELSVEQLKAMYDPYDQNSWFSPDSAAQNMDQSNTKQTDVTVREVIHRRARSQPEGRPNSLGGKEKQPEDRIEKTEAEKSEASKSITKLDSSSVLVLNVVEVEKSSKTSKPKFQRSVVSKSTPNIVSVTAGQIGDQKHLVMPENGRDTSRLSSRNIKTEDHTVDGVKTVEVTQTHKPNDKIRAQYIVAGERTSVRYISKSTDQLTSNYDEPTVKETPAQFQEQPTEKQVKAPKKDGGIRHFFGKIRRAKSEPNLDKNFDILDIDSDHGGKKQDSQKLKEEKKFHESSPSSSKGLKASSLYPKFKNFKKNFTKSKQNKSDGSFNDSVVDSGKETTRSDELLETSDFSESDIKRENVELTESQVNVDYKTIDSPVSCERVNLARSYQSNASEAGQTLVEVHPQSTDKKTKSPASPVMSPRSARKRFFSGGNRIKPVHVTSIENERNQREKENKTGLKGGLTTETEKTVEDKGKVTKDWETSLHTSSPVTSTANFQDRPNKSEKMESRAINNSRVTSVQSSIQVNSKLHQNKTRRSPTTLNESDKLHDKPTKYRVTEVTSGAVSSTRRENVGIENNSYHMQRNIFHEDIRTTSKEQKENEDLNGQMNEKSDGARKDLDSKPEELHTKESKNLEIASPKTKHRSFFRTKIFTSSGKIESTQGNKKTERKEEAIEPEEQENKAPLNTEQEESLKTGKSNQLDNNALTQTESDESSKNDGKKIHERSKEGKKVKNPNQITKEEKSELGTKIKGFITKVLPQKDKSSSRDAKEVSGKTKFKESEGSSDENNNRSVIISGRNDQKGTISYSSTTQSKRTTSVAKYLGESDNEKTKLDEEQQPDIMKVNLSHSSREEPTTSHISKVKHVGDSKTVKNGSLEILSEKQTSFSNESFTTVATKARQRQKDLDVNGLKETNANGSCSKQDEIITKTEMTDNVEALDPVLDFFEEAFNDDKSKNDQKSLSKSQETQDTERNGTLERIKGFTIKHTKTSSLVLNKSMENDLDSVGKDGEENIQKKLKIQELNTTNEGNYIYHSSTTL